MVANTSCRASFIVRGEGRNSFIIMYHSIAGDTAEDIIIAMQFKVFTRSVGPSLTAFHSVGS